MTRPISKTQYTQGVRCRKLFWLHREKPELAEEITPVQQATFDQGHQIGRLAQECFPGGVLIKQDHHDPAGALRATEEALRSGAPAIFEAALAFRDLMVRADVLKRNKDGSFDLIEVKSSTRLQPVHLPDIAFQKYVAQKAGIRIENSCLMTLDPEFRLPEGAFPPQKLFVIRPLSSELAEAESELESQLSALRMTALHPSEPVRDIGSHCKNPYRCKFTSYCWGGIGPQSFHFLSRLAQDRREELAALGIETVQDIPEGFRLSAAQEVEWQTARLGHHVLWKEPVLEHLAELKYPAIFLDFETVAFALPRYVGTGPYQQLPFQWSAHIRKTENGALEHAEFLWNKDTDPRRALAESLVTLCQRKDLRNGSIVAYHASFEKSRILEMAREFGDLELEPIAERLWDLETPFARRWYWDFRFQGRSSIKNVMPVLVPELTYKKLEIQKGDQAQMAYQKMVTLDENDPEKKRIFDALLAYCKLDTLAMVEVLEALKKIVKNY